MNRSRPSGMSACRARLALALSPTKTAREAAKPQAEIGDNVSPITVLWLPPKVAGEPIPAHKSRSKRCDLMQVVHTWVKP